MLLQSPWRAPNTGRAAGLSDQQILDATESQPAGTNTDNSDMPIVKQDVELQVTVHQQSDKSIATPERLSATKRYETTTQDGMEGPIEEERLKS